MNLLMESLRNPSVALQRRIRCCGVITDVKPSSDPAVAKAIRAQRHAAWWLSWLVGFPCGWVADPRLVTALILDRWKESPDYLTLHDIRMSLACSPENPCDTCRLPGGDENEEVAP